MDVSLIGLEDLRDPLWQPDYRTHFLFIPAKFAIHKKAQDHIVYTEQNNLILGQALIIAETNSRTDPSR